MTSCPARRRGPILGAPSTNRGRTYIANEGNMTVESADLAPANRERRTVHIPSTGARVCLLLAALLLVAAAYFVFTPLMVTTASGSSWNCGSALNPPTDDFGAGLCGQLNSSFLARAIASGAAALVTGIGGFLLFGSNARPEVRRIAAEQADPS